jgi:hypothetical protein
MFTARAASHGYQLGRSLLAALACCALSGCGAGTPQYQPPPVGGLVLWEDGTEPRDLEGSTVEFESNGTVAAKASLTADGTFRLEQALPEGKYRVRLTPAAVKTSLLDPRYQSFETSGLTFTAGSGPQQANFKVKQRGR